MSFNKYKFESFKQFQAVQNLATTHGIKTAKEFDKFLETNYSHLKT